jgi:hypothetical protein
MIMLDFSPVRSNEQTMATSFLPPRKGAEPTTAVMRFVGGLSRDNPHLAQIADVAGQAGAAR